MIRFSLIFSLLILIINELFNSGKIYYSILFFTIIITLITIFAVLLEKKDKKIENQKNVIFNLYELTDNVNYPIFTLDKKNKITYANKSFLKFFNYKIIINRNIYDLIPNFQRNIFELNDKMYEKKISESLNGNKKVFLIDISEKYYIEQLRKEFSSNVSHELKTPLTTIIGYTEMLSLNMIEKDKIIDISKKIHKQSIELLELLENIIKISKLEEGKFEEVKEIVNLESIINEKLDYFSKKILDNEIKIEIIKKENIYLNVNKKLLEEIIYNLISNAIKYNNEKKYILITLENGGFSIENSCDKLNDEELDRIFERFYRAKNALNSNISGNGLGLSIVKHAILLNSGNILVKNTEIGLKFIIKI